MREIVCKSEEETVQFAKQLAKQLHGGELIALFGGMGMGKTAFVRGLCEGLCYPGEVSSPTFAIVQEYRGGRLPVYHFDMYRVTDWDSLYSTGFFEYLESGGVTVTEWSENIEGALPDTYIKIQFRLGEKDSERVLTVENENADFGN